MSISTFARVRCECGAYREVSVNREGYAVEACVGCGYRLSLRGNPPVSSETPRKYFIKADDPRLPVCVAEGCERKAASFNTDMCAEHCAERRKRKAREEWANRKKRRVA